MIYIFLKRNYNFMITKFKLFESPDTCDGNDWHDYDAVVFGYGMVVPDMDEYLDNWVAESEDEDESEAEYQDYIDAYSGEPEEKMLVGFGTTHNMLGVERNEMSFPGRLWYGSEIVSFWQYPHNYTQLWDILKDVQKACEEKGKKFEITDDWDIEVVINDDGDIIDPNDFDWEYIYKYNSEEHEEIEYSMPSKLIKIKDYPNL